MFHLIILYYLVTLCSRFVIFSALLNSSLPFTCFSVYNLGMFIALDMSLFMLKIKRNQVLTCLTEDLKYKLSLYPFCLCDLLKLNPLLQRFCIVASLSNDEKRIGKGWGIHVIILTLTQHHTLTKSMPLCCLSCHAC